MRHKRHSPAKRLFEGGRYNNYNPLSYTEAVGFPMFSFGTSESASGRGMKQPPRLTTLRPRVEMASQRLTPRPKTADPYYLTAEHKAWRAEVCRQAGWRCEAVEDGRRCEKSRANGDRMFADHIRERSDGGPDQGPGMCMCGAHHVLKTNRNRRGRHGL
jgi:5-methylcytosine-specific restriction protein A